MKTPPDETTLTLWMDGLLEGEELQQMEAWAQQHPELLAEREAIQSMCQDIKSTVPNSVEPPYPDFFNQRIMNAIKEETPAPTHAVEKNSNGFWKWLAAPLAAGAMALCFYLGTQASTPEVSTANHTATLAAPTVYTPDNGVQANIFVDDTQAATVIVIEGLQDIPDDLGMAGSPRIDDPNKVMISSDHIH